MDTANRFSLPAILTASAFAYLMSNLAQFGLDAAGVPPYFTEVAAQGLILCAISLGLASDARELRFSPGFNAIMLFVALLFLWTLIPYLYSSQSKVVTQIFIQYVRTLAIVVTVAYAILLTRAETAVAYSAVGLAVVGSIINLQDFIDPIFSQVPGRAAGLYANPNISGTILIYLALIGSTRLATVPTYVLWSTVSVGVALTFSRSAWLILIISLVGLAILGRLGRGRGRIIFVSIISIFVGFIFISLISGDLYYIVARSPLSQYLDPNTIARLGASGSVIDDYSTMEREGVLRAGWQAFLDSPIYGHGLGYTLEWSEPVSTHNMFVLYLAERGLLGCLIYILMLSAILACTRGVYRLLAIAIWIDAFFTHNQLDLMCEAAAIGAVIASTSRRDPATQSSEKAAPPHGEIYA